MAEDDNVSLQREELEALSSIYGDDFVLEEEDPTPTFTVLIRPSADKCGEREKEVSLTVTFSSQYPKEAPPIYHLSIPWLRGDEKKNIILQLDEIYLEHVGESVVYLWVEKLREILEESETVSNILPSSSANMEDALAQLELDDGNQQVKPKDRYQSSENTQEKGFKIMTGEPFTDRKSTFQAHLAQISKAGDVRLVLNELYTNKKIATATHNMYAFRIVNEGTSFQDCDDDGETHAGSRLLHLLQILDCRNVMIVVTRWYGGIQLHSDRFKHINNVARNLLQQQGFIHQPTKGSKK